MREINRRGFMAAAAAAALAGFTHGRQTFAAEQPSRQPNIVFILADDLGWADLGCYGNRFHETPNLDRLASQGVRFTDAYAACPVCSPTRASIMAGQYPARVGITDFIPGHWRPYEKLRVPINRTQYLPLEVVTLAETLKQAGYATGMFGKWHLGGREQSPDKQGFDDVLESNGRHFKFTTNPPREYPEDAYLAEVLTDESERFMEENRERPFFLYLAHFAVHIPLEARKALIEKYENKAKPEGGVNNPVYAAMVEHVDQSVGRVMDKLDALGLSENTLLVFMSDNGGLWQRYDGQGEIVTSNAPLRGEKGTLYEGGIREPLIMRLPGTIEAGTECAAPVTSVDFYPTFVAAARGMLPEGQALDGVDLAPLLRDDPLDREAIFWHYPHYHHSVPAGAVRAADWKLIEFYDDGHVELYNLAEDIGETNNLADAMPEKARELRERLAAWRNEVDAAMPEPNPDHDPARAGEWGKIPGWPPPIPAK